MVSEADEAAGLTPGNEENEAGCYFSPEKPRLPLSTEGIVDKNHFIIWRNSTMVKIRLRRLGAKKAPFYRVVVADSRFPRDGRFIEEIGTYNPCVSPAEIKIDADRAKEWIKSGAQPTDTVRALLKKVDVL